MELKETASKLVKKKKKKLERKLLVMVPEIEALPPDPAQKRNFRWVLMKPPNLWSRMRAENFLKLHKMSHPAGSVPSRTEGRLLCSRRKKPVQLSSTRHPPPCPPGSFSREWCREHQKVFPNLRKGTELFERALMDQERQLALNKKDARCLVWTDSTTE